MWNTATGWLSNLNPAHWFNDINPYQGHAEENLVPVGEMVFGGLQKGMQSGWGKTTDWLKGIDPSQHVSAGQMGRGGGGSLAITIHNPVGETSDTSIHRTMQKVKFHGLMPPELWDVRKSG
jgi:hypothetical protein